MLKIDGKCSHICGLKYDLIMILDSGLLFWATLYKFLPAEWVRKDGHAEVKGRDQ